MHLFFVYLKQNDRLIQHICNSNLSDMLLNKFDEYITVVLDSKFHLSDPMRVSDSYLRHFVAGGLFKCLVEWTKEGMAEPPEHIAARVAGFIVRIVDDPSPAL